MTRAFDGMEYVPDRPSGNPNGYDRKTIVLELEKCIGDSDKSEYGVVYWLKNYAQIFNNDAGGNVPFELWDFDVEYQNQLQALETLVKKNRVIALKARQVGMTTLCLAYFLYDMLFRPKAFVLILSRGEQEAKELLKKLKNMFDALPVWMRSDVVSDSLTEWRLGNGSVAYSISSHKGDSFSATHVLIDEAALLHRSNISLSQVLLNLAPTVGLRGKLFMVSKADKSRPSSHFNSLYRGGLKGESEYTSIFIPYDVVPGRTAQWYEKQKKLSLMIDGTLDFIYETYPSTPEEALAPKSINKRFAKTWLDRCYEEREPIIKVTGDEVIGLETSIEEFSEMGMERQLPLINGVRIYELPMPGEQYVVSADPGEGLETSDDSALSVMKIDGREQVLVLNEKIEPSLFASYIDLIARFYNHSPILYELNEHGRAVGLWLRDHSDLKQLKGWAATEGSRKVGWTQNSASKPLAFHEAAERLKSGDCTFYDYETYVQLSTIESGTNAAPKGLHDDLSIAFVLSLAAIEFCVATLSFDTVRIK
jgi:hypothetical protein